MREILRESNFDLLNEVEQLIMVLASAPSVPELVAYQDHLRRACARLREQICNNLQDLQLGRDEILPAILSETQRLSQELKLYDTRLAGPALRVQETDRLPLRVVQWLHRSHQKTKDIPTAVSTDEFAIWPAPPHPVIYFLPATTQQGLLYQSLFFHEFGHLLYACHKPEMDHLVEELQTQLAELLTPLARHNDIYDQVEAQQHNAIILTWYSWLQELFCDAVGLTIGGPAFLHAFNRFMRMSPRKEYHCLPEQLIFRSHPVAWLRIRLIARRARELGCERVANDMERQWAVTATTLRVIEDYYGFYDEAYLPTIWETLEDMLVEAEPYSFTEQDLSEVEWTPGTSLVHLLNYAWYKFEQKPKEYVPWEREVIVTFLSATT